MHSSMVACARENIASTTEVGDRLDVLGGRSGDNNKDIAVPATVAFVRIGAKRSRKSTPHRAPGSVNEMPLPTQCTKKAAPAKRQQAKETKKVTIDCLRPTPSVISKVPPLTQKPKRTIKPTSRFEQFQVSMKVKGVMQRERFHGIDSNSTPDVFGASTPLVV
eukprot:CAMPEP_0114244268 /NCGR_PEP_ID=MMETSP0058-20121206/11245_1 /TAXON_ID=36894 /ORGANISM="Pyramimonas parkeae, CCMP726" /LENGTH=162 /DNA_ID=CAMNT_0001357189 /DNA_START=494 /DNA_END=982 /DNA_ORIENTATION=-